MKITKGLAAILGEQRFTMQIGLFIIRLDREFAIHRLKDVARHGPSAA